MLILVMLPAAAAFSAACYAYPETRLDVEQNGAIFASSRANYSCRVGSTVLKGGSGCADLKLGSKTGKACHYTVLSLFSFGSKSPTTAMKNAGIETIKSIDYSNLSVLRISNVASFIAYAWNISLFNQECVHVNGD